MEISKLFLCISLSAGFLANFKYMEIKTQAANISHACYYELDKLYSVFVIMQHTSETNI